MIYYTTKKGMQIIHKEIENLEKKIRTLQSRTREVVESAGSGDMTHDNPGYDDLKMQLEILDKSLNNKYGILNNSQIVSYPSKVTEVCLGCRACLEIDNKKVEYEIVGYGEEDYNKRICYDTPLAHAIMGKKAGEIANLKLNNGVKDIKIIKVEPLKKLRDKL